MLGLARNRSAAKDHESGEEVRLGRGDAILVVKTGESLPAVKAACGDFEEWIERGLGSEAPPVLVAAVYAGDELPPAESLAGVIVTGSPAMVSALEDWSEASARWLGQIVERDTIPVLGLCYGHQLIAHGLGGEVGMNPRGREMGTVGVTISPAVAEGHPLLDPGLFPGHMSHLESVLVPPKDAKVLATTELEPHAVLQFGPRQWGTQFHPEFDREIMQRYIQARREVLTGEGRDPDELIARTVETPVLSRVIERFCSVVRRGG